MQTVSPNASKSRLQKSSPHPADVLVELVAPEVDMGDSWNFKTSLKVWMDNAFTDSPKYAIWFSSAPGEVRGFILKEISVETESSAKILAKIADFKIYYPIDESPIPMPPTSAVDCIVY